jgi:MurNAc alpha-1-phosphate uridylyltransferase
MIFAAGRGERMRPLTDHTPKPLLQVGGKPLIQYHLEALAGSVEQVVINISHLGAQIREFVGNGSRWGLEVAWSEETEALETAGGLLQAAPLLGTQPFLVVNGDVWTDYPLAALVGRGLEAGRLAHLVMVDNPAQHSGGDFSLGPEGSLRRARPGDASLTYAGVGIFSLELLAGAVPGKQRLRPFLDTAIDGGQISAEHYRGAWVDVGTAQRLQALDKHLR